jgi:indolepyruvate ferredoxin oxidoreductase beta subunit
VNKRKENLQYVTLEQIIENLSKKTKNIKTVNGHKLAIESGNPRTENIVLLGVASKTNGFPLTRNQIINAIEKIVPQRTIQVNVKAFNLGENA